jgi:predicted small lipoprotein YifL
LIERHHPAQLPGAWGSLRAGRVRVSLVLAFALTLAGCHKKIPLVLPQVSTAPIDVEVPPEPEDPPMIAEVPPPDLTPAVPVPAPPKKVTRRKPTPPPAPPPVQVASAAPDPAAAIGSLSTGGSSTPQNQQQAKELIESIKKRIEALPGKTASGQKAQLRQVSYFLKQAQQALDSGDVEGANNLAIKARLLMDDIEKK